MIEPALLDGIREGQTFLCVSHVSPDGDAVGSLLGMGWILHALGKTATLALQDPVPDGLEILPGAETIVDVYGVGDDYDRIICLDASSIDRMGTIYRPAHEQTPLYVIDHHATNTNFGVINWVEPECAAVCQMLLYLAQALGVQIEKPLAECLLTGLVTDTLCFRTSNTDARVLEAATIFMQAGADLSEITQQTLNRRPFAVLQVWGKALTNVQLEEGVIWAKVSRAQIEEIGDLDLDPGLSSTLITAIEADISAVFTEKFNAEGSPEIECSFRAKPGFNVGDIAFELGGGGHPAASGCTIPGTLDEVIETVVPKLKTVRAVQATTVK